MFEHLTLAQKIGQLLIVGFMGTSPQENDVQKLADHIANSRVSGIVIKARNIQTPSQLAQLNQFLRQKAKDSKLPPFIIGLDQEGGSVQRLNSEKGFINTPSAKEIAHQTAEEARTLYEKMAMNMEKVGINMNFAPCLDLDIGGEKSPAIGQWGRSYSSDPMIVIKYGRIMIEALHKYSCLSTIKHFPGYGSAETNPQNEFVDVTETWTEKELEPFFQLGKEADAVMTAHVINRKIDSDRPATLSLKTLEILRKRYPQVVIISDSYFSTWF